MNKIKFWILHITFLFIIFLICCIWAYNKSTTIDEIPTFFRVTGSRTFGPVKITTLQSGDRYYNTKSLTPQIGYTFIVNDYNVIKRFSLSDYEFSKGVLAEIDFDITHNRHCDWICMMIQSRGSFIKSLESN